MLIMARIVIDGRWIKQTGIGRYVENLLEAMIALDVDHEFVLLIRPEDRKDLSPSITKLELIEVDALWYTPQEQLRLPKVLEAAKPDLVHFTNFNVPLQYRKPFVVTVHDLTMLRFKNVRSGVITPLTYRLKDVVMRHVLKTAITRSRKVFVPTQYVVDDIVKHYHIKPDKLAVTTNAIDQVLIKPRGDLKKLGITEPYLFHVGNAYPSKNLARLLTAYQQIRRAQPDYPYHLVFVGKKDEFLRRIEKQAKKLKLVDWVRFTDRVSEGELAQIYKHTTAYVIPALSEGFGIPGLEAMHYGVPVVSSNATCLPEVYGKAAEFFDPRKPDDIAAAIRRVTDNPKRQAELKRLGTQQLKHYSWKKSAQVLLKGYESALKAQPDRNLIHRLTGRR